MISEKEIEMKLEEYKGLLISTARRYKINGMDTDDIIQELSMQFVMALKDYDKNKNTNLKTLFITYAKNWFYNKLRTQNTLKRGVEIPLVSEDLENDDKGWYVTSLEPAPDEMEYAERLGEAIDCFLKKDKDGYLLKRSMNGETYEKISKDENVSVQRIGIRVKKARERLITFLEERGYEVK